MITINKNAELPVLPYGRQCVEDDDIAAVVECLRGDWLTQGPRIAQFEAALCEATGARHAVAVSSGTAALHLAAIVAGVQPGDTGVTSAITFVASANCIAYCDGEPYFADVEPSTGLIDVDSLATVVDELRRTGRPPKLIVPVDFAGQPADLPAIKRIAESCGAMVVEDAAHSLGAAYVHEGRTYRAGCCAHSDMAILSFHPVKHVTTGEGGAILTNDAAQAERLRKLRSHGIHRDAAKLTRPDEGSWYYEQDELGFHYRITDLQCALGLSQIKKLERFVARRQELARQYDEAFAEDSFSDVLSPLRRAPQTVANAYHLYVVRLARRPSESLESLAARRKAWHVALRERNILCQIHYVPVPMQPWYESRCRDRSSCDGASWFYASCLTLPLFPSMVDRDADRVIEALREIRSNA